MPEEKYSIEFYLKHEKGGKTEYRELDKVESLMLIDALQGLYPEDESIKRLSDLYRRKVISFASNKNDRTIYVLFKKESSMLQILENKLENLFLNLKK